MRKNRRERKRGGEPINKQRTEIDQYKRNFSPEVNIKHEYHGNIIAYLVIQKQKF